MTLLSIKDLAEKMAKQIVDDMKSLSASNFLLSIGKDSHLSGFPNDVFKHRGLYGLRIAKDGQSSIAYIGKTENDSRLRHHILGVNKNGTELATSVAHKNEEIRKAIATGCTLHLCLFKDKDFDKATLSCLEIACVLYARSEFQKTFPDLQHWNQRVG